MNEQSYQNREIIEYLLGSLPAAETERFDELSIISEEFAGTLDAAENQLLDAYACGELAGETLEKFQSYYLASSLRRKKATFAETFQIYGKRNQEKTVENMIFAQATPEQTSDGAFSFLNIFKNQNLLLRFGFTFGALLLMIAGGFWFLNNRANDETAKRNAPSNVQTQEPKQIEENRSANLNQEIAVVNSNSDSAAPPPAKPSPRKTPNAQPADALEPEKAIAPPKVIVASFFLAPPVRGDSQVKSLSIPNQTTEINMNLELETDDFPLYLAALTDESGSIKLWRSGKVKAITKGENKFLSIRFPAKLLKSKIHSLVVSGINADGEVEILGNYTFRSVLK